MGAKHLEEISSFDVGGFACKLRALSVGAFEALSGRALNYVTAQEKEDVILSCLIEPISLIELIKEGSVEAGIPLSIYDYILQYSGFSLTAERRDEILNTARVRIGSNIIESCRVMILASGIRNIEQIQELSMKQMLEMVALSERVMDIRQQNIGAALGGGESLKLTWDKTNPHEAEIQKLHAEKEPEVQELINSQLKTARGMRRI